MTNLKPKAKTLLSGSHSKILIFLTLGAILLWTINLGGVPLRDWDEGYYAIVARDMVENNNWLYLTYLDEPFLLKPPLMIWLVALTYKIAGISELTSRLTVSLITAFGVPLIYGLSHELFTPSPSLTPFKNNQVNGSSFPSESSQFLSSAPIKNSHHYFHPLTPLFTALVYLTLLPIVRHGRLAMMDGMIVTLFLFALFTLLKSRRQKFWGIGVGISLAGIALTKGILVILLGGILGVLIFINRQWQLLKNPYLWLGILLGAFGVISWYLLQYQEYGQTFIQVHFQSQSFDRLSTAVEGNRGSIFYYGIELLKYTLPWLLFLPQGLKMAWQGKNTLGGSLILIGFVLYFGTISLMGTKLPWYILPVYPFFALAVGIDLAQLWQEPHQFKALTWLFYTLSGGMAGGIVYFILADPQPILILMAGILVVTFGLSARFKQQQNQKFILTLWGGMYLSLGLLMLSTSWNWELNETFSAKPVGTLINHSTPPQTRVYTSFNYKRPSLDFYSDRNVIPADFSTLQQLSQESHYLLLDAPTLKQIDLSFSETLGTAENFTLIQTHPHPLPSSNLNG